jgi:hypothetical protein
MKLSVCCMTVDPPARVAQILKFLRSAADEIVVAVDSVVDPCLLGAFGGVADRIFRFEYRPPVDRPRAWLAAQCQGDWVLWIDGDEVPSPALVQKLPGLLTARDVLNYHIARRWLFPEAGYWLEETPWYPDFQTRLVRNDPATMWFGGTHCPIGPMLPAKYVEEPLYHLSCLVHAIGERRAKARRYDVDCPGMISPAGGPFNEALQLPEQYATLRPVRVPAGDQPWIEAALIATAEPPAPTGPPGRAPLVSSAEIDAVSPARGFDDNAYAARIVVVERDTRLAPGITRTILTRVENRGTGTWPFGLHQSPAVRLGFRWVHGDGQALPYHARRTALPTTVRPGDSLLVPVEVVPPEKPGRYVLELDLVHENVRWFGRPTRLEILVTDRWQRFDPELTTPALAPRHPPAVT